MHRLATPLLLVALAAALFGAWMHWAVLLPGNVGWLLAGGDRGQSAIGLAAWWRAGHWPSLHEPLLDAPEGLGLLFTDSIPLIAVVLGPAATLLPGGWQFIGVWLLACVLLQVTFAWLLLRPHAPDRLTALLATALLAAMPALFNRYVHASLCAQWLILWGMWIHAAPHRAERPGWWIAALGIAALVHSYLLLMVAGFWGAALIRLAWERRWREGAIVALAPLATVVAILAWQGVFGGSFVSTGTYGAFPAALDAWWNPGHQDYSALLPSSESPGHGFEGFNYLGAGLLLLVVAALVRRVSAGPLTRRGVSLGWLVPVFAVFALLAIAPQPLWRSVPLGEVHLSATVVNLLDPVRAAGRLLWPVTYTLAYAALVATLRRRRSMLWLGLAVAVQVIDLAPMLAAVRATSAGADDRRANHRTLDPRWGALIARAGSIEFEPAEPFRDLQLMEEVTWRAVSACRPVRYFYASRDEAATRRRVAADTAAFRAGRLDPTRLYVLLDGRAPAALAGRVERIDGVAVIAPTRPAPAPACAISSPSSPRSAS